MENNRLSKNERGQAIKLAINRHNDEMAGKCVCGHNYTSHSVYGHGSKACAACECGEWDYRRTNPVV